MLTDSILSVIGVNNHRKDAILFSKTFLDGWQNRATKSTWRRTLIDNKSRITEPLSICTHRIVITILWAWAGRAELQYSGTFQIQKRPALSRNLQSFVDCSMERSIRYNFLIDLESIQHKLSSDHSLSTYFSLRFYIDGPSFSPYKPLQNLHFCKVGNMQFFFRNCTHILTRTREKILRKCFSSK